MFVDQRVQCNQVSKSTDGLKFTVFAMAFGKIYISKTYGNRYIFTLVKALYLDSLIMCCIKTSNSYTGKLHSLLHVKSLFSLNAALIFLSWEEKNTVVVVLFKPNLESIE